MISGNCCLGKMIQILTFDKVNWKALGSKAREISKTVDLENPFAYSKAVPHSVVTFSFLCTVDVYTYAWLSKYTDLKTVTIEVGRTDCEFIIQGTLDKYIETFNQMTPEMEPEALAFYSELYLVMRSTDLKEFLPQTKQHGEYLIRRSDV